MPVLHQQPDLGPLGTGALRKHLGTDVRVTTRRRGRGFLTLSYYSNDDLARLLELILGRPYQG